MNSLHQFYLEHMASKTGYRATWTPDLPLYLGAVVTLERGAFTIQSDLESEGIPMRVLESASEGAMNYTSSEDVTIDTKIAGQAPIAGSVLSSGEAGFSIEFLNNEGIIFQAEKTRFHQLSNVGQIEQEVVQRVNGKGKAWPKDWLIVTQLMNADTATIIISYSHNSKIDLKANVNVSAGQLRLTDASLGLSVAREKGSHLKLIAQKGITPLYRVMGYHHPLFGRDSLRSKGPVSKTTREHFDQQGFQLQSFDPVESQLLRAV